VWLEVIWLHASTLVQELEFNRSLHLRFESLIEVWLFDWMNFSSICNLFEFKSRVLIHQFGFDASESWNLNSVTVPITHISNLRSNIRIRCPPCMGFVIYSFSSTTFEALTVIRLLLLLIW
jgi:hypothetical protein